MVKCKWCGQDRTLAEMRYRGQSRGVTPSACQTCRDTHPDQNWCDWHEAPHPLADFAPAQGAKRRPGAVFNICRTGYSERASAYRNLPPLTCDSCGETKPSYGFAGGRMKSAACKVCIAAHPGLGWCRGCRRWEPVALFTRQPDGRNIFGRCRPCRAAYAHGVTVARILEIQGSDTPECAACGSLDSLKVDHDHRHCPGDVGCAECVRGYLCHACNTAEGLLRTPERVEALAAYMRRDTLALTR